MSPDISVPQFSEEASLPQFSKVSLSPNAVKCMVNASKFPGTLIVRLFHFRRPPPACDDQQPNDGSRLLATISDGTHCCIGLIFRAHKIKGLSDCIISIRGYITSQANPSNRSPLVCVTDFEILYELENQFTQLEDDDLLCSDHRVVQGGSVGTFLATNKMDDTDLAGESSLSIDFPRWKQDSTKVSEFLAQHFAMRTLQTTEEDKSWVGSPSKSTSEALQSYTKAMREFGNSQLALQAASLTGLEGDTSQVLDQNRRTLEHALTCLDQPLTKNLLCQWHIMLMGDGLHPDSGKIRTTIARSESIVFCPPNQIQQELDQLCQTLQTLENSLVPHSGTESNSNMALGQITFAAAAMFGVLDIHPFSDGNGRLARIVLNWALRRVGLPFCIHLFATPTQRSEYITAIERTRQNICLAPRGEVSDADLLAALKCAGVLSPIVALLLDRISRAADEFGRLVSEKALLASEEAEARAVRRARERAAQGTCIICFDEKPNIATLCCGKAVHLNCIAEWLSAHTSCPQCRSDLPSLPARNRVNSARDISDEEDDSMVEQLLNYITNETDADLSSSSSSSSDSASLSSASSSSSSSSLLTYNELHYRIHYGSSDDESDHDTEGNGSHEVDYADMFNDSGLDSSRSIPDSLESLRRHVNDSGLDSSDMNSNRIHPRSIRASLESLPQRNPGLTGQSEGTIRFRDADTLDRRLALMIEQNAFGFADSSSTGDDDDDDDEAPDTGRFAPDSFPRLSFLDPSLLHEVQQQPQQQRDCDQSSYAGSSSGDEDDSDRSFNADVPLLGVFTSLPRPVTFPDTSDDSFPEHSSNQISSSVSLAPWLIRDHFAFSDDDSDVYDSEHSSTSGVDDASSTSEVAPPTMENDAPSAGMSRYGAPPVLCFEENCRNRAAKACCNKKCGRCCVVHGSYPCTRHSGRMQTEA
jgi:fido (protein-threonine AMPylation protein)